MVQMNDVSMVYKASGTVAADHLSFNIEEGEFVFLVGPSGSGKTTIIKLLTGEIRAQEGEINVNGYDLRSIRRRKLPRFRGTLGVIFQDFRLIDNKSVYDNVAFAMHVVGASKKEIRERVPYVLKLVGLEGREKRKPQELSGGEQQRVAIARAIAHKPEVLFADEPTAELDTNTGLQVLKIFRELCASEGVTIIMTTHDTGLMELGDVTYQLEDGELVE